MLRRKEKLGKRGEVLGRGVREASPRSLGQSWGRWGESPWVSGKGSSPVQRPWGRNSAVMGWLAGCGRGEQWEIRSECGQSSRPCPPSGLLLLPLNEKKANRRWILSGGVMWCDPHCKEQLYFHVKNRLKEGKERSQKNCWEVLTLIQMKDDEG